MGEGAAVGASDGEINGGEYENQENDGSGLFEGLDGRHLAGLLLSVLTLDTDHSGRMKDSQRDVTLSFEGGVTEGRMFEIWGR